MSLDLKIIPTNPEVLSWKSIYDELRSHIGPAERGVLGDHATLHEIGTKRRVAEDAPLELDKHYYIEAAAPNTLIISVPSKTHSLDEDDLDEVEYLNDYGHSWDDAAINDLAQGWRAANYHYEVSSLGGRGANEPALQIALATALARLSAGIVLVMDRDRFDLSPGYYSPEQFQHARWLK
jgi:hypothetical protein